MSNELQKHTEKLRRSAIDKEIREGRYPQIVPRKIKPGRLVPFPSLLLRVPLFKYSHRVSEYTLQVPLRFTTSWGLVYYIGPALGQNELTVLASALQAAGKQILRGPRKSYGNLRAVGDSDSNRGLTIEDPAVASAADQYEMLDAIFGETYLTDLTVFAFGAKGGKQLQRTRNALMRLWSGRFFAQVNPKKEHPDLPGWLTYEGDAKHSRADKETVLDEVDDRPLVLSPRMSKVLSYDPANGATSPLTGHPFFDAVFKNSLDMTGGIRFIFSPFLTQLLDDRETFLELKLRESLGDDGLALQLSSFIASQTSQEDPDMRLGYDKLLAAIGWDLTIKREKDGAVTETLNRGEFKRQVEKRCAKLEKAGFLEDWFTKPSATRKTEILIVRRNFSRAQEPSSSSDSESMTSGS